MSKLTILQITVYENNKNKISILLIHCFVRCGADFYFENVYSQTACVVPLGERYFINIKEEVLITTHNLCSIKVDWKDLIRTKYCVLITLDLNYTTF